MTTTVIVHAHPAHPFRSVDVFIEKEGKSEEFVMQDGAERTFYIHGEQTIVVSESEAVVVYRDASGKIRYPPRNDQPTPPNCERIVMRSIAEVRSFERAHGVSNEAMEYDRGSGRSRDGGDLAPARSALPERERFRRFLSGWGKA